jgi:acetoin utilization protein AcuC
MNAVFFYTPRYLDFDYGIHHPLRIARLALTHQLISDCGLFSSPKIKIVETPEATDEELLGFHTASYLEALKKAETGAMSLDLMAYGMGPGDNPVFPGLLSWSRLLSGATLAGAGMVAKGEVPVIFNIAGGMHHAYPSRASGFCYINDPVLGIRHLLKKAQKVLYLDVDAHHGDGVQAAFYHDPRVLTLSLHQDGRTLFPGSGFVSEIGSGEGKGYAVNIPLYPGTNDEIFGFAFQEVVVPLIEAFKPEYLVTQLGVDTFAGDPLANLNLGTGAFCRVLTHLKSLQIPWVAVGGGGYHLGNVARAWTLAWAILSDQALPEEIPVDFIKRFADLEEDLPGTLQDPPPKEPFPVNPRAWEAAKQVVDFLKNTLFPIHGLKAL